MILLSATAAGDTREAVLARGMGVAVTRAALGATRGTKGATTAAIKAAGRHTEGADAMATTRATGVTMTIGETTEDDRRTIIAPVVGVAEADRGPTMATAETATATRQGEPASQYVQRTKLKNCPLKAISRQRHHRQPFVTLESYFLSQVKWRCQLSSQ